MFDNLTGANFNDNLDETPKQDRKGNDPYAKGAGTRNGVSCETIEREK